MSLPQGIWIFCTSDIWGSCQSRDKTACSPSPVAPCRNLGVSLWQGLIDIFCGLTFYPIEHIAWARDKKLLHGKSAKLWDLSLYCWIGSLIACIFRDLWLLKKLHDQQWKMKKPGSKTQSGDSDILRSSREPESSSLIRHNQIRSLQQRLIISIIGFTVDLGMAINWAPAGILWAQKLSIGSVGLLGTVSSLCELYKYFKPASPLPNEALGSIL